MGREPDVFDEIRAACETVTERARFVRIDAGGLEAFADRLAATEWPSSSLDPAHHFLGEERETLAFVIALDAINFGSGWFPFLKKRPGMSGYRTIASGVKEFVESEGAPDGPALRSMTAARMARMLGQEDGPPESAELMALFARAWRDLGEWLARDHDDRFERAIEACERRASRLVTALAGMPLYRDVADYEGLAVPLYKRAQITVVDLSLAFQGEGPGRFEDLDSLTLFADNLVPHVLRCEGVLCYAEELGRRIDAEELLEAGSLVETEIRAVAVTAVERLVAALGERGVPTTAHALDGLLWNAGQAPEIKAHPRHRARSPYY